MKRYLLNGCLMALLLIDPGLLFFGAEGKDSIYVPPLVDEILDYESKYNQHPNKIVKEIVPIYHVDKPLREVSYNISTSFPKDIEQQVIIFKDGKQYLRIFYRNPLKVVDEQQQYYGAKITSHNTHIIWDPSDQSKPPFRVKLTDESAIRGGDFSAAVNMSKFLESDGLDPKIAGYFFPEPFAVQGEVVGRKYYNIIRPLFPLNRPLQENELIIPLFAYVDSPLESKARKFFGNVTIQREQLLTNLAKWLARLHYIYGIYIESHTQNIQLIIDRDTGKIIDFAFQDLHDVAIDPILRMLVGKVPVADSIRSMSIINNQHVDHSPTPGDIMFKYSRQITDHQEYFSGRYHFTRFRFIPHFIKNYYDEVKHIFNKDFDFVPANLSEFTLLHKKVIFFLVDKSINHNRQFVEIPSKQVAAHIAQQSYSVEYRPYKPPVFNGPIKTFFDGSNILILDAENNPLAASVALNKFEIEKLGLLPFISPCSLVLKNVKHVSVPAP